MRRLAIFVDAGYLFAQGSTAISGAKKQRTDLSLNESAAIAQLLQTADELSGQIPLLRIYWYDAIDVRRGPTADHDRLAYSKNVKVRFGALNGHGQQKGVDSLIVTDLIELARNHAISDAVLISGDEDVRVGVQLAQSYGVRVHLIGIVPSRGSQSIALIQEADTHCEWDAAIVSSFLTIRPPTATKPKPTVTKQVTATTPAPTAPVVSKESTTDQLPNIINKANPGTTDLLDAFMAKHCDSIVSNDVVKLKTYWSTKNDIPREFDGKLLARAGESLERRLSAQEIKYVRVLFQEYVQKRQP
ncbi:NYN domain-containing protein [Pseudomonas sp. LRF_L74]|uniref:NYN domain-containing protein n=1 Tax=Pseudomonas sp. LRF_L74 TaxID=3369422 RepID=UPI003F5E52EF